MYNLLKTKIVATIGPASSDVKTIIKMLESGMTVARINMSHGNEKSHLETIKNIRLASKKSKLPVAILQDLSGPKIRIGDFSTETIILKKGQTFILNTKKMVGNNNEVFVNYKKIPKEVEVGTFIYLNDGKQKLKVKKVTDTTVHTTVIVGGAIRGRRGVNLPEANLSISSLTPKDRRDLKFGLEQGVDFVTLSFVRHSKDLKQLKKLLGGNAPAVVAKIETRQAIENLSDIINEADVLMVARGDLAIETPLEKVPLLQKEIISQANKHGKPVITATQMLDSMRTSDTPTRAEINDIANAIIDGSDALMLSDETAVGNNPPKVVSLMAKVAKEIENSHLFLETYHQKIKEFKLTSVTDTITKNAYESVNVLSAKAIIALTESGYTAIMSARHRPPVPILALTPNKSTFNKLLLVFGCDPVLISKDYINDVTDAQKKSKHIVQQYKLVKHKENYIIIAGIPFHESGTTNLVMVETLK